jgi:hypothetical protein
MQVFNKLRRVLYATGRSKDNSNFIVQFQIHPKLEPPSDTFEVFEKPGKKLKFDHKSQEGTKGVCTGIYTKFSFQIF